MGTVLFPAAPALPGVTAQCDVGFGSQGSGYLDAKSATESLSEKSLS